jgi:heptaprenyl diphosphate synthase
LLKPNGVAFLSNNQHAAAWKIDMQNTSTARWIALMGLMLSLSLILHWFEGLLPPPGIPGARWGLANIVTMVVLLSGGWRDALLLVVLRQLVGGALTGKLFGIGFMFGLAGGVASVLVMALLYYNKRFAVSLLGLAIAGAIAHNWAQWLVASYLVGSAAMLYYLPLLTLIAIPCGAITGLIIRQVAVYLGHGIQAPLRLAIKDVFMLAVALFIALGAPVYWQATAGPGTGKIAVIIVGQEERFRFDLSKDLVKTLTLPNYSYLIEIKDGRIRVREANCPTQVCATMGWISRADRKIICAPGRMVITIVGPPRPGDVDGVLK